ncbi:MAG: polysaccharide biosynthesis/export family protein [Gemmatimonadota bacterium]
MAEALSSSSLQPGDAVRLEVFREPEISREYQVDERGVVVFPLIGERDVTGFAPDSLRTTLVEAYSKYLREPSISVTLLRRINILGEVRSPGLYPVDATMSLADALALAGGVSPAGNSKDIRLIRSGQTLRQDLNQTTLVGSSRIRSGDQIVVGQRSWISRNPGALVSIIAGALTATAIIVTN